MSNPEWHDESGKFSGARRGPGRPRGVPAFEKVMRRMLSDNAEEFGEVMLKLLREGDGKAWDLMTKRAFPEPPKELDVTSDGGPVVFSWREADAPKVKAEAPEPEEQGS